ncbi:hypothetical protein ANAPC5_00265 [Anaplasma phagocytophilum]|nr:hypothetical protein ANAPC3_00047 [Anaplasma phagocytophilum]SBO30760.1 hypothetical protein ANAPC4_00288 [Anaplasma phagocytophilum]SBO30899.1 hypothetical protein ANAPC4_00327 [Anaplasma phagocytophilum]SBO31242.1 hypothetical protein ANAPC2_00570 [Anaplasma phagocytophilum]SCV62495.1 hypothetical protein ANAPC5_00265 [Anaplasma phagocytophilum]
MNDVILSLSWREVIVGIYRGRRVRCLMVDVVCSLVSKLKSKGELYWC